MGRLMINCNTLRNTKLILFINIVRQVCMQVKWHVSIKIVTDVKHLTYLWQGDITWDEMPQNFMMNETID